MGYPALFFPAELSIPEPPSNLAECGPEWRIGWMVGWETGPAREPFWNGRRPRIGRYSPLSSKRTRALNEGVSAGREAKRALIAEHLASIESAGTPLTATWRNYPRDGWLYADAFFFPYSTSKLPACVPAADVLP